MQGFKCPKCGYDRKKNESAPDYECPACGVIYSKVTKGKVDRRIEQPVAKTLPRVTVQGKQLTSDQRINEQLSKLGEFDMWFTKKEIKYLPDIIRKDETILGIASGLLDGNTWLIVVTNQRMLFLDKGMIYGLKQMEMHYDQISAVSHQMGLLLAKITVSTSGGTKTIDGVQKKDAPKICQLISDQIRQLREPKKITHPQAERKTNNIDVISQLERLAGLLDKGILTKDEFEAQKAKIINA